MISASTGSLRRSWARPRLDSGSRLERHWLALDRVQRARDRHREAGEARRVAHRVRRGLGAAQTLHEIEERADVVGVECHHELLIVEPERVRRVIVHTRIFAPDLDVPLHDSPALLCGQRIPGARLHERVHEYVLPPEPPRRRALVFGVLGLLPHPQKRVRDLRPLHQPALSQHNVQLVDAIEVLRLGDQQQLRVAARTYQREGLQQMAVGEVLAGGVELALVLRALLVIEPAPGGVELQERVLDEVPRAHSLIIASPNPVARPPWRIQWYRCGSRCFRRIRGRTPVGSLVTSRRSPRSSARSATTHASSPRSTPTTRSRAVCTAVLVPSAWSRPSSSSRSGAPPAFPPTALSQTSCPSPAGYSRCAASCATAATT